MKDSEREFYESNAEEMANLLEEKQAEIDALWEEVRRLSKRQKSSIKTPDLSTAYPPLSKTKKAGP